MLRTIRWFLLALAGLLLSIALIVWARHETVQFTAAILGVFLLLPLTIVSYMDAVRHLADAASNGPTRTIFLSLPIRLLGGLCLLTGVAMVVWFCYNLFIQRRREFTVIGSGFQLLVPVGLVFLGWRWVKAPISRTAKDEGESTA